MERKKKLVIVITLILLSLGTAFVMFRWISKPNVEEDKVQTAEEPTINLADELNEDQMEEAVYEEEAENEFEYVDYSNSIPELIENTFNYLASDNPDSLTSMRYTEDDLERMDEEQKVIPKDFEVNKFFCCKQTALDFAYSLNLTTPSGRLEYGQLTDNNLVIETAKPGDVYKLTKDLVIIDITNSYSSPQNVDLEKALDVTVNYEAGVSKGYRRYHIYFDDSGRIFDFKVTDMNTEHKESSQGGED